MGTKVSIHNGLAISVPANGKFVAVTGADGFIGSHIVKILLGKGYMVRGTVKDPARAHFLKELPRAVENLSLFKGELLDEGCYDDVFRGCDCVFHLASPTLKDQREMKSPEGIIDIVRLGTLNVLQSCKKAGVKAVVITSSMCAASSPDRPKMINESNWADHMLQKSKGSYYNASKTWAERDAVEFVSKMPIESAFRLVRICPSFTVGPMLQPTVNSSMERFAAICNGTHHKRIPNDSRSLIDVRDTAAHHVAAYEKGFEGRFFSTTETWPWTLIYQALKFYRPQMKCPSPVPLGTKLRPLREINKTRMSALGVKERSMMKFLGDAVKACEQKQLLDSGSVSFLEIAGYYDLGSGNGSFLMVDVQCMVVDNQLTKNQVKISYVIGGQSQPTIVQSVPQDALAAGASTGEVTLTLSPLNLTFSILSGEEEQKEKIFVKGSIGVTPISGRSFITYVPISTFQGTYVTEDGSDTLSIDTRGKYSITLSDGTILDGFSYDPLKRAFMFKQTDIVIRLYLNVAPGNGLILRYVQYDPNNLKNDPITRVYVLNTKVTDAPEGPTVGAESLATFAGWYPLSPVGFVSIMGTTGPKANVLVGVNTDGEEATQYSSFKFQNDTLTFANPKAPSIEFSTLPTSVPDSRVIVTPADGSIASGVNAFSVAPLAAFGHRTLTGNNNSALSITPSANGPSSISFKLDGVNIFKTTDYEYQPVEQDVLYDNFRLNFCYNFDGGVTCGVTRTDKAEFNAVLFAYPPQKTN